ncbi:metallophosphoesterase [Desertibacillus haloalkaliphilus]|uniref:metallophosphoesterase n=1 Tax=Desertibacillus haloalkaliphilus TaxID=1328930 RepID=UPI001C2809BC|nr:metallophosphoesterase [Desertibacillus haloalkaliphilus]MBU8907207.1 metallophosphoesterase family protein [Desertibacillus haloalkaliphilus]
MIVLVGVLILSLCLYMYLEAHRTHVEKRELYLPGFPRSFDGVRLFFITDIHFRAVSDRIIEQIRGTADIIIIGGDLLEKNVPFQRAEENIKKLRAIAPVYFVWGNNDYEADFRRLDVMLMEQGVTILDNTAVTFEQEDEKLILVGVDDVGHHRDRLDLALKDSENGYRILVSHYPDIIDKVPTDAGIGLVLSGHTHGGQIRFLGFGLREKGGVKTVGRIVQVISNGFGTTRVPFRLGARAETHLFTLRAKSPETRDK